MAAKHRVFLTGNDRNEVEHVLGIKLPVDDSDPRFVLLTDEQEEAVRKFPAGAPANRGDHWPRAKEVLEATRGKGDLAAAFGVEAGDEGDSGVAESATKSPAPGEKARSDVKAKDVEKLDAEAEEDAKEADEKPAARKGASK